MRPILSGSFRIRQNATRRAVCFLGLLFALTSLIPAGGHQSPYWAAQNGAGDALGNGDYVSDDSGLNTYYRYWIEVPAGLTQMRIWIFDADTGGLNDFQTGTTWNTTTWYDVYYPSGSRYNGFSAGENSGYDNQWAYYEINNPTAGHWSLTVDSSSAITTGDDTNVYGVAATDTSSGATRELNVYAESYVGYGIEDIASRTFTVYPYMDCGCEADSNDFDYDSAGSIALTSRTGEYTESFGSSEISGGGTWANNPFEGWTADLSADDYGIWTNRLTITATTSNVITYYMGAYNAADPAPTAQPEADTLRLYLPTEAGTAPVKPYAGQYATWISGPNPPAAGETTRVRVTVWVVNPTPHAITFNASNTVDAYIPGGAAVYAGNDAVTQGSVTAEPAVGGSGAVTWNPGTLAAGASAWLSYQVDVTPTIAGQRVAVTGGAPSTTIYSWNLDTNPGWTKYPNTTENEWAFGDPGGSGGDPDTAYTGLNVYGYNLSGTYDSDMDEFALTTTAINCSQLQNTELRFWRWLGVEQYDPAEYCYDHAYIRVSTTGGAPWTEIWSNGNTDIIDTSWTQVSYDISDYADGQSTVYIRWVMGTTDTYVNYSGWNIDDIEILGTTDANNGTTATYVDETGNTTQTRATFTFGPLCGLVVTEDGSDIPTRVLLADFGGVWAGGEPALRWSTASEQGTVGFYVSRWDAADGGWRRLTDALLPALPGHPQGGVYRLPDPAADRAATEHYLVEEVEADGTVHAYGPFAVDWAEPLPRDRAAAPVRFSRAAHPGRPVPAARPESDGAPSDADAFKAAAAPAFKLAVPAADLYAVDLGAIAAGLPRQALRADRLALTAGGVPVATRPFPDGQGFYFFGDARHTLYADTDIYRFTPGKLTPILGPDDAAPVAPVADGTFAETLDVERDRLPAPAVTRNPESDYWFWDYLYAGDPALETKTFAVATPGAAGTGAAALTVRLHGGSDTGALAEHQVAVRLNGVPLGDGSWSGRTARALRFTLDPALLRDGDNQVELTARRGDGGAYSLVYLDGFTVEYQRRCLAVANRLRLRGLDEDVITVAGFDRNDLAVLDVTDPAAPRLQPATVDFAAGSWRVSFRPERGRDYFAVAWSAATPLAKATADRPSDLRNAATAADYLVIAPRALRTPANRLAAYRADQGYRTLVVDIENIYDEFNHGRPSPHAVRGFLSHAATAWAVPPRFVVLAGRGTFDYRDRQGSGDNLLPPIYTGTPHGLAAADMRYGCVAGDDNVPELAIGRLPATTAAELQAMVDKIIAYEAQPAGDWSRRALVVADDPDPAGDFPADSEDIAAGLPLDLVVERIYLSEQTPADARAALLNGFDAGAGLVNYLGHGGVDRLAAEGLLRITDIPKLANGARLPLLLAFTCAVGECTIPGYPGLGEALLTQPDGGAIAVYAPAGLSDNAAAAALNAALAAELGRGHATLGDAIRAALAAWTPADPTAAYHRDLYILLGDPALLIKR